MANWVPATRENLSREVFPANIYFQAIGKSFLPQKKPAITVCLQYESRK